VFEVERSKIKIYGVFLFALFLLVIGTMASVLIGATHTGVGTFISALFNPDGSKEQVVIRTLRLPRAVLAIIVGANLAVAGALMQALTRNPLASPQVFGVNAGASLIVVSSLVLFPAMSASTTVYFALLGALLGGIVVYSFASGGGITDVKLALAGMAVHLFLSSLTQAFIVMSEQAKDVLYWLVGAIDGKDWSHVQIILPWAIVGLIAAILCAKSISIFVLGESVAQGLGLKVKGIRVFVSLIVVILAGSSVAVAGPIGFVGLIVPHIVRKIFGSGNYTIILPFSALFGAVLMVYADVLSRFIAYPFESPVGIVTALIGAPFFLYLATKRKEAKS
jgi:iron complex transport system permease protein